MRFFAGALAILLFSAPLLTSCSDQPEPEPGMEDVAVPAERKPRQKSEADRVWPGLAEGMCGSRVVVVAADGSRKEYFPPEQFFTQFESHEISTGGESPRPAIDLASIMNHYAADGVRFMSCIGGDVSLDSAMLEKRPGVLVLTGRGLLKVAGQQGEDYITAIRQIKEIRFASTLAVTGAPATTDAAVEDVHSQ